ncbi:MULTISPECIES: serine O-acetyltransferase EpsC [Lactobacillales]|uniref:serine O-acetyltransferase EpsC n=1 Tax=Lactobacillales TaxID=186826 RepID=UPI0011EFBAFE|nr:MULTISPECIES: serine O-acetyltransferase EpsC [Lactobacillales]KAF3306232.1 serine acetyltransferase [Carnobacterium sp. PL17GRE32]MEC1386021.1 serine O-acetyltransferase [Aerococcus viridans]
MINLIKKFGKFIIDSGYQAIVLYRISHFFWIRNFKLIARIITRISIMINSIEISPGANLGNNVIISHGIGTVIGINSVIGDNVLIRQNVTIGQKGNSHLLHDEYPTIENNVSIGAGTVILGKVNVGENVIIGANSVVTKDVPNNSVIAGVPFKIIKNI